MRYDWTGNVSALATRDASGWRGELTIPTRIGEIHVVSWLPTGTLDTLRRLARGAQLGQILVSGDDPDELVCGSDEIGFVPALAPYIGPLLGALAGGGGGGGGGANPLGLVQQIGQGLAQTLGPMAGPLPEQALRMLLGQGGGTPRTPEELARALGVTPPQPGGPSMTSSAAPGVTAAPGALWLGLADMARQAVQGPSTPARDSTMTPYLGAGSVLGQGLGLTQGPTAGELFGVQAPQIASLLRTALRAVDAGAAAQGGSPEALDAVHRASVSAQEKVARALRIAENLIGA